MTHTGYVALSVLTIFFSFLLVSCSTEDKEALPPDAGVPLSLAQDRAARLRDITYHLIFNLPTERTGSIPAHLDLQFELTGSDRPLALDFKAPGSPVSEVIANGEKIDVVIEQEHLLIPARNLQEGTNQLSIEFIAGDQSLNRSEDYLYTLFVPDRARTAFPCFDQPDLKARYQLTLSVPNDWEAVANGPGLSMDEKDDGRRVFLFGETDPIPTYLFAFAAGRFQRVSQERNGRPMTMYYRETDEKKVAANMDTIFGLHAAALNWLENYTGIPYPFAKFDFVLLPGFQYGGMEHPGCIFYKEPSLMLDPASTENQKLGRARLIAHETSHMWFGDLVTMKWFNDVWLKEVFANFMAAKIADPGFPEINHDLSFLLAHQPAAYAEDRSEGTHPIQQELDNLRDAGSLYGRIIYQKAPVVMRQLEALLGTDTFREGLRAYLRAYAYGNASWDDLIAILDDASLAGLAAWSDTWVKQARMPVLNYSLQSSGPNLSALTLIQEETAPNGAYWPQHTEIALIYADTVVRLPVDIAGERTPVPAVAGFPVPLALIPNATPIAYGYFRPDTRSRNFLLEETDSLSDPLLRGAAWLTLYEAALRGDLAPDTLMSAIRRALPAEREPLNRDNLLGMLNTLFWRFTGTAQQRRIAPELEPEIWRLVLAADSIGTRTACFRAYQSLAFSEEAAGRLYRIWEGTDQVNGLPLSENDLTALAEALALRLPGQADTILARQLRAITNPDRRQRLAFILPALSPRQEVRDSFFESLKKVENRRYEPWVVDAVEYLHHPLRAAESGKYILPSLELMEEIQATGDIFFPQQWISATLSGHRSPEAAAAVRTFLNQRPDYPYRLKNKILIAADLLFRAGSKG